MFSRSSCAICVRDSALARACWSVAPDSSCDDTQGVVKVQQGMLPRMRAKVTVSPCPWPTPFLSGSVICLVSCHVVMSQTLLWLKNLSEKDACMVAELVSQLYGLLTRSKRHGFGPHGDAADGPEDSPVDGREHAQPCRAIDEDQRGERSTRSRSEARRSGTQ